MIAALALVGCGNPEADRALFTAVRADSIQAVEQAIAAGADVNAKDQSCPMDWTPLHNATTKEVVELLIANGADVNAKGVPRKDNSSQGETPLHFPKTKEIAELLIAAGADVNAKDTNFETPLDYAMSVKESEVADLLRKHGGKTSKQLEAAAD